MMQRSGHIYNIILTVFFLCIISFSCLNDVFHFSIIPEISQSENRKLTPHPILDINYLDPFPVIYEHYFNDHFPFRPDALKLNSLITFFILHRSPVPDEVELGKHGWLFYDQRESVVYEGKFMLQDNEISGLVRELHERALECRKKGIRFYVTFLPMKPEIYPEYLPYTFRRNPGGTLTDKIVNVILKDSLITYINVKKKLLESKKYNRLYNITDNHWNSIGGFYAYSEIINRIKVDFPQIKNLTRSDLIFKPEIHPPGNLANMIGLGKYLKEVVYVPVLKHSRVINIPSYRKIPDEVRNKTTYEIIKATGDRSLPKIMVIRDSYTDVLIPYLSESFQQCNYIFDAWRYGRHEEIINDVKPDIVLLIIFEPHISHLYDFYR
jgi:alginate O-acetyltransferase complex protein AlgJ